MFKEFKEFLAQGNVIELAVALVIGSAFGKIVTSLVDDVIMPPIGLLLGKVDFANLFVNLTDTVYKSVADAKAAGAPTINYGIFVNTVISFIIIAFVIFLIVRWINKYRKVELPKGE